MSNFHVYLPCHGLVAYPDLDCQSHVDPVNHSPLIQLIDHVTH